MMYAKLKFGFLNKSFADLLCLNRFINGQTNHPSFGGNGGVTFFLIFAIHSAVIGVASKLVFYDSRDSSSGNQQRVNCHTIWEYAEQICYTIDCRETPFSAFMIITLAIMGGCDCLYWDNNITRTADFAPWEPRIFSLPVPIPRWPDGLGFGGGRIFLEELEIAEVTKFQFIWGCSLSSDARQGVSFYKPVEIPEGFFSLGHYCQPNVRPLRGFVLVARECNLSGNNTSHDNDSVYSPALVKPVDYTLVWSSNDGNEQVYDLPGYFWEPQPPEGYKATGFVVTNKPDKPDMDEVRCVRANLTDTCERCGLILDTRSTYLRLPFRVWKIRPCDRGITGRGVSVGTFFCSGVWTFGEELQIACLKNFDKSWHAMPNLDQINAVIHHYGPTLYFHPQERYLPSSVEWFFKNGALLFKSGQSSGEAIEPFGSNLPGGGTNDGCFWIDLPSGDQREVVKRGDIQSAELYVHVKPALGGSFTDIAMWVFCPFNGPGTLKVGPLNYAFSKVGEHVGDWEHFTLRISNFTGELHSIYFSQHSGGVWVDACDLEYVEGNRAIVYSSKNGHASYPHPGCHLQGNSMIGIGVRNDCARSNQFVDSSSRYLIVAAEYLKDKVAEPNWLQFMREWGPKIMYDSRTELDKILHRLPLMLRYSAQSFFNKFPVELYGEEGPTGPKEKNNWNGDERW